MQEKKFYWCPFLQIRFEEMESFKMHWIKKPTPLFYTNFLKSTTLHFSPRMIQALYRLKNASCLWFGRFSSRVKRCICVCLQRFMRELKHPNQRQGAFLRPLKWTNHPGVKAQSCISQKVGFSKWCLLFDLIYFWPCPLPSGGFIQKIPNPSRFHLTRVICL